MLKLVTALAFVAPAFAGITNIYPYSGQPFSTTPYTAVPQYRQVPLVVTPTVAAPYVQTYASPQPHIPILRHDQDIREDGSYQYQYETANGIVAEEHGGVKNIGPNAGSVAQGSYSYTSPEGKVISISYIADENGFHAVGDAIPTPPPVPIAIQRALAYIAAHPQRVENAYEQRYY